MRLRFIKEDYLRKLKDLSRDEWLQKYYEASGHPWLTSFFGNNKWHDDTGIDVLEENLLLPQNASPEKDAASAKRLYELLKDKITASQAADPRFWVYMCHETCWEYMVKRWEIKNNIDIDARYFIKGASIRAFTRNGIARLWWFAHLTYDKNRNDHYELTELLLKNQNIQHHLLGRNFGMNKNILHAVLDMSKDYSAIFLSGNIQSKMDTLAKLVNRWGGVRLLDYLERKEIESYVMDRKNVFND